MTTIDTFDPFERRITDAIDEIAAARRPEYLDSVLQRTARSRQRPRWVSSERWLPLNRFRYAAAAVAVVIVAVVGFSLAGGKPTPSIGASTPPSVAPSQAARVTQAPIPTTQLPAGVTAVAANALLASGKTYTVAAFTPAFTFVGHDGWSIAVANSALLQGAVDTSGNSENGAFTVMRVGEVLEPGGAYGGPAAALPADIVAWFRARPDLILQAPTAIKVGGLDATLLRGSVRPEAVNPDNARLVVACQVGVGKCTADNLNTGLVLWAGAGSGFEIVALKVQDQQILIAVSANGWEAVRPQLEAFLAGITFE